MKTPTFERLSSPAGRAVSRGTLAAVGSSLLTCLLATTAYAHLALVGSRPAAGAEIDGDLPSVRLEFSQPIQLPFTEIALTGPSGAVRLDAPVLAADSPNVVYAGLKNVLQPGDYTIAWRVAGSDGHPIAGELGFRVAPPAAPQIAGMADDSASRADAKDGASEDSRRDPGAPTAGAPAAGGPAGPTLSSVGFGLTRFLTFTALLALIGATAFRSIVLPRAETDPALTSPEDRSALVSGAARVVGVAAFVLLATAAVRIYLQAEAVGIDLNDAARIRGMLFNTPWGRGWILQVVGAAAALAGMSIVGGIRRRRGWVLIAAGALAAALSPALSGHAVAAAELAPLPILADMLHVLGAGGWLGTLLVIVAVGLPVTRAMPPGRRAAATRALVSAFSPAALGFAALVVATGVFAAVIHLDAAGDLWRSGYGRTLLVKIAFLVPVFAAGAYNWRRATPRLGDEGSVESIRRSASAELGVAILVLVATAVLVATPPPSDPPAARMDAPTLTTAP